MELEFILMALGHNFRKMVANASKVWRNFVPTHALICKILPLNSQAIILTIQNQGSKD